MLQFVTPRRRIAAAALVLTALSAGPLRAQAVNTDKSGLALYGYDAVSYVSDQKAVKGSPDFTATHDGNTYRFASAEHRDQFAANPAAYLPAYGGYCAYGVSRGYKVKVDPEAFTVVDGTLYLNYDKGVQKKWLADVPGFIATADSNWARIKDQLRN